MKSQTEQGGVGGAGAQGQQIIDQIGHASYALKRVRPIADAIMADDSASHTERLLASCIIALERSMLPSWVNIGGI